VVQDSVQLLDRLFDVSEETTVSARSGAVSDLLEAIVRVQSASVLWR